MPVDLTPLLPHLPVWTLVLFRLSGIFIFAPVFASKSIPTRVKIFFSLGLSFCVYPMLLAHGSPAEAMVGQMFHRELTLPAMFGAVAMELLVGVALGFGASLPLLGMEVAGHVADQQLGFSFAGLVNPETDTETGPVGQFYYLLAISIFLIAGGHRVLLTTLVSSFDHIPLGGMQAGPHLLSLFTGLLTSAFELALRVSAPLLCLVFLETVVMGFIARTVPQMNIMSVGFAVRILVGSLVIIAALHVQYGVFLEYMRRSLRDMNVFFTGG